MWVDKNMTNKKNEKTINVKLDADTKSKFETLAYLKDASLQDLTLQLIKNAISDNAEVIAEVEKVRSKFKK